MKSSRSTSDKIRPPASGDPVSGWSAQFPRPMVFTNGCFDILHRGHVAYLETAAGLGESLVVGLNTDDSVRRLGKDVNRPYNPLADRMAVIASLACVDGVIAFDEDTPLELITALRPEVLVKGGDWPVEDIVGGSEVTGWGGSVRSIPFEHDRSTTSLIDRIRENQTQKT